MGLTRKSAGLGQNLSYLVCEIMIDVEVMFCSYNLCFKVITDLCFDVNILGFTFGCPYIQLVITQIDFHHCTG